MEITDSGINSAVEDGLRSEKGVFPNDVDVSTSQGIVTLSGSAGNILAKERAAKIAESFRGVRGVIDLTIVAPESRPDVDIQRDAMTALQQDPATESYKVVVSVQGAIATLTGSTGSYAERQLAARIVEGIKGIKGVRNDVSINYLATRTDSEITADVKARLQWDIWINGDLINATVKDGNVTLTGSAGSVLSRSRALEDAWLNGVMSVDASAVKIEPSPKTDAHQSLQYSIRSDSEVQLAVQTALRLDPRVSAFSPDVTVEGGVVILAGSVGDLKARTSAGQDARNTVSVWRVENLLKVRPKQRPTDPEMQTELKAALLWDPQLDSSTIDVAVINRVAYLSGSVESSFENGEAQEVASRIKGVVIVHNHLVIEPDFTVTSTGWPFYSYYGYPFYNEPYVTEISGPRPYPSDAQIQKRITDAFFWSPFVHFDDVKVTVNGGVAILTGTVGTSIGWGEAEKDAHKSGASEVLNHIEVKKGAWF